jgi:hypothetical protein
MKRFNKYASGLLLTGVLSIVLITAAYAQRGGGGHLGGGGHIGGGVGFHGSSGLSVQGGGNYRGSTGIRNNVGVSRTSAGLSYRSGTGYFAGSGYHSGAFYRPGFGYFGYPHVGFYLGVLPLGYYPFYWGSSLYYYSGGVFYSPYDNGGYQVTAPPLGAGVPNIPKNAQAIKIDGVQYYEVDGVYYNESVNDKGEKIYVVAGRDGVLNTDDSVTDPNAAPTVSAPKIGDIINQLPDGCRKVTLNGKKYFVSPNDIYYEKVTDPDGNVAYRIASLPDDEKGI